VELVFRTVISGFATSATECLRHFSAESDGFQLSSLAKTWVGSDFGRE
jgi:hypothetical protein